MNTYNQALTAKEIALLTSSLDDDGYCVCAVSNAPITAKVFTDTYRVETISGFDLAAQSYLTSDGQAYKYAKPVTFDIGTTSFEFYS